jgi:signal transduction histidine kinase
VEIALAPGVDAVVLVDKHKVKQALANVLDNAIEATPAGGRVEVAASLEGATARITVRDSGPGIAEEVRARLFTPFCTTKRNAIGLGLVLARELLEAHGGAIAWRPAAPGTEFVLTFPERPEEAARRRSGRAPG